MFNLDEFYIFNKGFREKGIYMLLLVLFLKINKNILAINLTWLSTCIINLKEVNVKFMKMILHSMSYILLLLYISC